MFLALQEEEILFFVQLSQPQVSQGDRVARRGFQGRFLRIARIARVSKKGLHGMAGLNSLFTGEMHHVQKCFTGKEL